MELQGERTIPAPRERTWAALNDPLILKDCIAGCESLERDGDSGMLALVAVKVGPVSARFKGKLQLSDVVPQQSYTMHFDGQGGVAGFGKGSADVKLADAGAGRTTLAYVARAQVGGKLAQIGSRLVDAAAAKIADDFFQAFEARLRAEAGTSPSAEEEAAARASLERSLRRRRQALWAAAAIIGAIIVYLATR
ncbi:MAG TPA: carbon monoxide dehydrogenase subunit G [Rubrivivax sp.]|nr:carbon monoxide dehydrogenase subunit G [Rubrivivax sp.]